MRTARSRASTARCTSPMIPCIIEKFYFTPGDLGFQFRNGLRSCRRAGVLGPVVSGSRAAHRDAAARMCSSIQPPSAGIPPKKRNTARRSMRRGRPSSVARHRQWRLCRGRANRVGHESGDVLGNRAAGQGLEFWGGCFPRRSVRPGDCAGIARQRRSAAEVDLHRMEDVRRNWPFWRDRRVDAYAPITQRFMV